MSMTAAGDLPSDKRVRIADLILRLRRAGISDQRVVSAIESVPREMFVPAESHADAYAERALPIDCGQTITAPVVVGIMTAALDVSDRDRVLEVGTGTGYQTAILSKLARRVYTVDRFRTLVSAAESRFRTLRLANVTTLVGDGMKGWPEQAPFDKIVVTAAAEDVPQPILRQVRVGGVIVMPVGPPEGIQKLTRMERTEDGFDERVLAEVRFVPLIPGRAERL
jgi:protein-L-isoaspartate(D-aspartate) O-methyltransferase